MTPSKRVIPWSPWSEKTPFRHLENSSGNERTGVRHTMNYRVVCRVLGLLTLLLAAAMLICGFYGYFADASNRPDKLDFALLKSFAIAAVIGGLLKYVGSKGGNEILRKEGIAIVGLGWIISTLLGAVPYVLCDPPLPPAAAIFESASGFTTTGSTAIADLDQYSHSILLWRSTTQWLGGMGILVLFVALLSTLGVGSKALFRFESSAQIGYGFHARIRQTALQLWQIYTGLTVIAVAGLMLLGMSFYDALLHGFAAVSTGGFGPKNESLIFYDSPAIEVWLTIIMLLGGMSFVLMAWFLRRNFRKVADDEEFRAYLLIFAVATIAITVDLMIRQDGPWLESLRFSSFQAASIMTTTGFASADFNQWPTLSKAILVLLMFIGGCAGSTSGSIKVSRFLIFSKTLVQQMTNAFRPNHVVPLRMNGATLDNDTKTAAVFFIALSCIIVGIGSLFITLLEPELNLVSAFTSVVTTLFNVGPGLDAVGPTKNFAHFSPASHLVFTFLMLLGRLELYALLVLFMPALWRRY
jgi:trk system potassium uptake protein TrkH